MTHDHRDGTDVNRGRAQVSLTCTCPANGAARFFASSSLLRLSLVLCGVNMVTGQRPGPSGAANTEGILRRVGPTLTWLGAMRG
ncbi:hypothetical protein Q5P01_022126 [Channa striata]|uniref:Uncharacterized protein n=1 Tax=Channa striata TaxID=64152 RepID=A0AA88J4K9_CHASR|nr:hypothetical protein Q5P01_022126 [Channa striata]